MTYLLKFYLWKARRFTFVGKVVRPREKLNLLLISGDDRWHYTSIKSLSRLLAGKNSKHHGKQHFCMNCLQGFTFELSRDKHYAYCIDNETVNAK